MPAQPITERRTPITDPSAQRYRQHRNGADLDVQLCAYEQNDIGNAKRLIDRFGHLMLYVVNVGWHVWDGKRWAIDGGDVAVKRFAQQTAKAIFGEIASLADKKAAEARAKWAIGSGYTQRLKGMLEQAAPHLSATSDDLDTDPWLFNCSNGTINLRVGTIRPHRQEDLITKLSPVDYDPDAVCPTWDRFIAEIFAGDQELVRFTQRGLGYSLTGITREHVIFILHGSGSNGKSVLLETVASILSDYARQCPSETFAMKDKGGGMSNDIARLAGARLVSVVETDQERRLAEGLVKQASGGDRMAARYLHHEFFEFTPKFKLWLATNHKPRIRGTDHGIWRRIRLLPFAVTFLEPEKAQLGDPVQDDKLKETLLEERPGILAWIVRGCIEWQEIGLMMPEAVQTATDAYREAQDALIGFLADRCNLDPSCDENFGALFTAYKFWCADNGETPVSGKSFGEKLDEKGIVPRKGAKGVRVRRGVSLKPEFAPRGED